MFRGSMVALITPMKANGDVDEAALEALVAFHLENGTDAIVAVGTTGESATLNYKEHRHVMKRVIDLVAGKIPVIAGTGSNSTAEAIEMTEIAMQDGADACLLVTPYYNKPTQEGLYQHYKLIAERVAIPQILYNVPGRTSCDMLPETVERLAAIPNIVGIKEATGNLERAADILQRCGDRMDLYSGDDATAMELILMGGKGDISVTANVAPKAMHEMCAAALAGDRETASRINATLAALHTDLFLEPNPMPVKWALAQMGFGDERGIRLPLVPCSEAIKPQVLAAMRQAGIEC
ncbi:4-hydroxy-tetrahydrodipicolinate synthase [Thiothrix subterranea]|uniref:4-hydroxy-tetrahydrodipicolinate synthase n=1 Tax=Thiothrix subterranea TaxID=2735563 RepID=A0AA51MSC0_9GAMM|nr:4-hydroxy-tetrahydrodipicolinate synthase [Thiothrix subterranea]MDQ5768990.1 4-hydroxy-tetrahydrodipicolinate synthase [Thiothrix subterranea]WML88451.1 4-hydroxy-tetrahydrodipicolinate synthase [Thiothrix subterranea]